MLVLPVIKSPWNVMLLPLRSVMLWIDPLLESMTYVSLSAVVRM
jgi:hypothetical protein